MEDIVQTMKLAIRRLLRNPGFTATAVATLSLSIGANTAIFSVVNALLLKGIPYDHPERIGTIHARTTEPDAVDVKRFIDGGCNKDGVTRESQIVSHLNKPLSESPSDWGVSLRLSLVLAKEEEMGRGGVVNARLLTLNPFVHADLLGEYCQQPLHFLVFYPLHFNRRVV